MQPDPAGRVVAPAIGLMIAGGVTAVTMLLGMLVLALFGVAILADADAREAMPGVAVWMGAGVIGLILSALTIYAGWQMRQFRNWGLCVAGSITAMLPCSICCILGLPMGIWALIVLLDNDVKQVFYGGPPPGGYGPPPGDYGPPPGDSGPPPGGYGSN